MHQVYCLAIHSHPLLRAMSYIAAQKRFIALEPRCILRSFAYSLLPFLPLLMSSSCKHLNFTSFLHMFYNSYTDKLFAFFRPAQHNNKNNHKNIVAQLKFIFQSCALYLLFCRKTFACNLIRSFTMLLIYLSSWNSFTRGTNLNGKLWLWFAKIIII